MNFDAAGLSNAIYRELLSAPKDSEHHVHFSPKMNIVRWFIFVKEFTVHSTRSPVKHCPISKRKIFPDSEDGALSFLGRVQKI
jgi:hypothetical protein